MSDSKFKVGDRVERIADNWCKVKKGAIYTIKAIGAGACNPLTLEEVTGEYALRGFRLAPNEEPKQCPIELVKVWEELQKPYEQRKSIEYLSDSGWVSAGKRVCTLSSNLQYRIKPEPKMTWEEFKEELFKLLELDNIRIIFKGDSVAVHKSEPSKIYEGRTTYRIFKYKKSDDLNKAILNIKANVGVSK